MEVVLALGIIAIAMVGIIGLIAFSMNSAKDSKDDTAVALMTQAVVSQLRETGYAVVTNNGAFTNTSYSGGAATTTYFFDASGNMIRDTSGAPVTVATSLPATASPLYTCAITALNPVNAAIYKSPISNPPTGGLAFIKLDFAWPYKAVIKNLQHKIIFTSLAKYDDF